jgi:hypothetical protein
MAPALGLEPRTCRLTEGLSLPGPRKLSMASAPRCLHKDLPGANKAMLAAVPSCAGECRIVRGDSVGSHRRSPDLWGFCGPRTRSPARHPGRQEHPGNASGAAPRQHLTAVRTSAPPRFLRVTDAVRAAGTRMPCPGPGAPGLLDRGNRSPSRRLAPASRRRRHSPPIPLTRASIPDRPLPPRLRHPATAGDHAGISRTASPRRTMPITGGRVRPP